MLSSIAAYLPAWGWLLISIAFYVVGEFVSKTWANSPSTVEVIVVLTASAVSSFFWLPALFAQNKLADMGTAWLVLAAAGTIFLGVVVFREELTEVQWTGVALAIVAFLLLTSNR